MRDWWLRGRTKSKAPHGKEPPVRSDTLCRDGVTASWCKGVGLFRVIRLVNFCVKVNKLKLIQTGDKSGTYGNPFEIPIHFTCRLKRLIDRYLQRFEITLNFYLVCEHHKTLDKISNLLYTTYSSHSSLWGTQKYPIFSFRSPGPQKYATRLSKRYIAWLEIYRNTRI